MSEILLREPSPDTTHIAPPELERVLAVHRDELKPEVRTYADNLHAQILAIFAKHGAKNYAEFENIARDQQLPISLLEHAQELMRKLLDVAEKGEIPKKEILKREYVDDEGFLHVIVDVDYTRSIADLIAAGKYEGRIDLGIREERFPREGSGTKVHDIVLIRFDHDVTSDVILAEFDRRGLRPVTMQELLTIGEQYPDLQRGSWIVELGSWQKHRDTIPEEDFFYVGMLYEVNEDSTIGPQRTVGFENVYRTDWHEHGGYVFPAIRKEQIPL